MRWHLFAFLPLLMDDACAWHLKGQHVPRWAFHTENHAKSGQFMWIYWRWECCSAGGCSGHKVRGCWSTRPSCGRQGHEVRSALLLLGVSSCPAHGRAWARRVLGSVIPPPSLPWAAVGRRRRWSVSLGKGQTWVGFPRACEEPLVCCWAGLQHGRSSSHEVKWGWPWPVACMCNFFLKTSCPTDLREESTFYYAKFFFFY